MDKREEKIRARAHKLWEKEGRPDGHAERHWQQAQQALRREAAKRRREREDAKFAGNSLLGNQKGPEETQSKE